MVTFIDDKHNKTNKRTTAENVLSSFLYSHHDFYWSTNSIQVVYNPYEIAGFAHGIMTIPVPKKYLKYYDSKTSEVIKYVPKPGKYTYINGTYKHSTIYKSIKNGVQEKKEIESLAESYTQTSNTFTFHSSLGHNNITFPLPATKGEEGKFDQGLRNYKVIDTGKTVKVAAGTFKNVVVVKISEPMNNYSALFYVAPNRGIILVSDEKGKNKGMELFKYQK
ncbi:DUF3298 domain-containing protein [Viridibacillus arvi]|uniref:DUF3298 domain-containing protein n=1 Tax=Viridibacillus arvi TaxID=263475 RepID=UPI00369677BC